MSEQLVQQNMRLRTERDRYKRAFDYLDANAGEILAREAWDDTNGRHVFWEIDGIDCGSDNLFDCVETLMAGDD